MKDTLRDFANWLVPKDSFRQKLFVSISVTLLKALIVGGLIGLMFYLIEWLLRKAVEGNQRNVVIDPRIVYAITSAILLLIGIIALQILFIIFQQGGRGKSTEAANAFNSDFMKNIGKILDINPPIEIVYRTDHMVYQVSVDGRDTLHAAYEILNCAKPITLLSISHYSSEALSYIPSINPKVRQGHAIDLPARNLKRRMEWLIFFNPPINDSGTFEYTLEWYNFWRPLREQGKDYVEYRAKERVETATVEVICPNSMGTLDWDETEFTLLDGVTIDRKIEAGTTKLIIRLNNPVVGKSYYFPIRKLIAPSGTASAAR